MQSLTRRQKFVLICSVFIAVSFALLYLVLIPLFPVIREYYFYQQKETFTKNQIPLLLHIATGTTALALGAVNIMRGFQRKTDKKHRMIGRIYAAAVAVSSLAGLYNAQFAHGGVVSRIGFSTLAVLWFSTLVMSVYNIVFRKNVPRHAFWMILNFSLTFAAVTLRLQLVPFTQPSSVFDIAYPIIAWTCWVPNLLVGYFIARSERSKLEHEHARVKN